MCVIVQIKRTGGHSIHTTRKVHVSHFLEQTLFPTSTPLNKDFRLDIYVLKIHSVRDIPYQTFMDRHIPDYKVAPDPDNENRRMKRRMKRIENRQRL